VAQNDAVRLGYTLHTQFGSTDVMCYAEDVSRSQWKATSDA